MVIAPSPILPLKPFLKWAGGKRQLIPAILTTHLPPDFDPTKKNCYFEPFIGGGALLLALQPAQAIIGDQNSELINCYQTIRDQLPELLVELAQHRNEAEYYYAVRQWDREANFHQRSAVSRAARLIFLNKTCYNGLFRVNTQGQFNVPFGRYRNPKILDMPTLAGIQAYLLKTTITMSCQDFQTTVKSAQAGDFIYFDPPYDPISDTASFTGYGANGFDRTQQVRLRDTFMELDHRGCFVLLSNSHTEFITELYKGYRISTIAASRSINSKSDRRGKINEVLIQNYP